MCGICGCSETAAHQHTHDHNHDHMLIEVEQNLLAKNNQFAMMNREFFQSNGLTAINLMSSPGSGKTTLLSKTIQAFHEQRAMTVIVGDQETDYDAKAIQSCGGTAIQVNTGRVCHLDAHAVGHALETLALQKPGIVFIENVGNLVCPALFDLGEKSRLVLLSVTEGDNKPMKYPEMFHRADLIVITKIDLLPYVDFDMNRCIEFIHQINPKAKVLRLSAKTGEGFAAWIDYLNLM